MAEMSEQSELDRALPATPYKLERSRERGVVHKSAEVVSVLVLCAAFAWLATGAWGALAAGLRFERVMFSRAAAISWSPETATALVRHFVDTGFSILLPFCAVLMVVGCVANLAQSGFVFSARPLVPDWSRVNPVQGLRRMFSLRIVADTLRAVLKLVLLCMVLYWGFVDLAPRLGVLANLSSGALLRVMIDAFSAVGFRLVFALGLVALLDYAWTRYEFAKKMRMSHRDMRDEVKHREGDPRIRARLRDLRRDMLKRSRSLAATAQADVVITNPTRLAVAISYRHGEMDAPKVLAKGAGKLAAAMRALAGKRGIPVVQNRTLARALWRSAPLEGAVPTALFADLARIMVWVITLKKAR